MTVKGRIRYLLYAFECFAAFLLQSLPFPALELFGARAALVLSAAFSIAFFESQVTSVIFAAMCGVLTDISYCGSIGFFSVIMPAACYSVSLLFENFFKRNLFTVTAAAFAGIAAVMFIHFFVFYLMRGYPDGWQFFAKRYIMRILCTLLAVPVFYGMDLLFFRIRSECMNG